MNELIIHILDGLFTFLGWIVLILVVMAIAGWFKIGIEVWL